MRTALPYPPPNGKRIADMGRHGSASVCLCGLFTVAECGDSGDCQRRTAASVELPAFIKIDVPQKRLVAADESKESTPIEHVKHLEGRLVLQGGEGGRGWSAVVNEETGQLSATVVDENVAFVVCGACTIP